VELFPDASNTSITPKELAIKRAGVIPPKDRCDGGITSVSPIGGEQFSLQKSSIYDIKQLKVYT